MCENGAALGWLPFPQKITCTSRLSLLKRYKGQDSKSVTMATLFVYTLLLLARDISEYFCHTWLAEDIDARAAVSPFYFLSEFFISPYSGSDIWPTLT